jgi:hypothetical protein
MKHLFLCGIIVCAVVAGTCLVSAETVILTPNTNWYIGCEEYPDYGVCNDLVNYQGYQGLIGYVFSGLARESTKVCFNLSPAAQGNVESVTLLFDANEVDSWLNLPATGPMRVKYLSPPSNCLPFCGTSCATCAGTQYLSVTVNEGNNVSFPINNAITDIQNAIDLDDDCFCLCLENDVAADYEIGLSNIHLELEITTGPPNPDNCNADSPICIGDDSELTADDPGSEYVLYWFDHDTTPVGPPDGYIGTGTSVLVSPLTTTTYYAWTYEDDAEEWSDASCSVEVIVLPLPGATASSNSSMENPVPEGGVLNLTGGPDGMTSYLWEAPNGATHNAQHWTINPANQADHQGTYTLTVFDGDCEGTAIVYAWVGDPPPIPVTGPIGIGLLLLTLGGLLGISRKRRRNEE